jgi:bacterioferritin-associated ferredoxin
MYLCACKGVSDQQIRQAVEQGARTIADASVRFGVGIECGKCIDGIREFLDTCLTASPDPASSILLLAGIGSVPPPTPAETVPTAVVSEPAPRRAAWFAIDL